MAVDDKVPSLLRCETEYSVAVYRHFWKSCCLYHDGSYKSQKDLTKVTIT